MWNWDQGHLGYFQFDALRSLSAFVLTHDLMRVDRPTAAAATGLDFAAPPTHSPWRQYSRALKLCLLVSEKDGAAQPTPVAAVLAQPGVATCDEYLHFLAQAATSPHPALKNWRPTAEFRYPLLFALKYMLAKASVSPGATASLNEIVGAYRQTGMDGTEIDLDFLMAIGQAGTYEPFGASVPDNLRRQAKESLKVLCQISYLHLEGANIFINLAADDARDLFADLHGIAGPRADDRDAEIRRLAVLFAGGSTQDNFHYPNTVVNEVVESGFLEGSKVQKTHVTIERNAGLRKAYFADHPTSVCDVCDVDTHLTFPWTERVLDLHHLLPLSSGTRVKKGGTTFDDLVPVCPSCHRGIHRYYGDWLRTSGKRDFAGRDEAVGVYENMKADFPGLIYA